MTTENTAPALAAATLAHTTGRVTIPADMDPIVVLGVADQVLRALERGFPHVRFLVTGREISLAGTQADIARAEALRQARERGEQVNGRLDTAAGGARIDTQASAGASFPAAQGQGPADRQDGTANSASSAGEAHGSNGHSATGHIPSSGRAVIQLDFDYLKGRGFLVPDDKTSKIHQEFRLVKRRLLDNAFGRLRPVVGNGRLIMVTSSLPSEGKTFSAIRLARSRAKRRSVALMKPAAPGCALVRLVRLFPVGRPA